MTIYKNVVLHITSTSCKGHDFLFQVASYLFTDLPIDSPTFLGHKKGQGERMNGSASWCAEGLYISLYVNAALCYSSCYGGFKFRQEFTPLYPLCRQQITKGKEWKCMVQDLPWKEQRHRQMFYIVFCLNFSHPPGWFNLFSLWG